jgi:alkanesulfonate monooxygenase SsuD/methylene tetrahydromethanopterin reductase-like flavin-dependent oxidoreductase (luciferase family)
MRLGYFTMPVHPLHRNWAETLKEDREAIILADKLGFSRRLHGRAPHRQGENITNSMMFLATLIHDTKQIKLATGTSNLSQMHPVLIAAQAAMFDHLSEGRFIFGSVPARCLRRRGARHPGRGPQQDVRRSDRRDPRDLGARSALRHRLPGQPLQGVSTARTFAPTSASA